MKVNFFDSVNKQKITPVADFQTSPKPEPKPKRTQWVVVLIPLLLLTGGSYVAYRQLKDLPPEASRLQPIRVEQTDLIVTVSANGTVEPEKLVNVSPKKSGILKELLVAEGDYLTQGQAIAKMDDLELQGQLIEAKGKLAQAEANLSKLLAGNRPQEIAQAQARLRQLKANLSKLLAGNRPQEIAQAQARLDSARANYEQAEDDFQRNQSLQQEGAISIRVLNEKRAIQQSAKAAVAEAEQALSLLKAGTRSEEIAQARAEVQTQQHILDLLQAGTRPEEIAQARAEVLAAQGVLKTIENQIEDTIVRAPFDGIVSRKYADPGAFVTPTTSGSSVDSATSSSILSIASENQVVASVAEKNIAKIQLNQAVAIAADAYPGQNFSGRVTQIATQATVEQNVTSFEVQVALEGEPAKQLRAGMNVSVEFQVGELENVLTVPTIAVTNQNNQTGVFVGAPNQPPKFVPITTGITVSDRTEVKNGLDGTEHILINRPSAPPPPSGFSWQKLFGGGNNPPPGGNPPPPHPR